LLDSLEAGARVKALSPQRPLEPVIGKIVSISAATVDQPATGSGLAEPPLPSGTPERFVALAMFDNADGRLRPGSVVRARIYSRRSSYAGRALVVLMRWVRTLVW
ncbi:MAG: hypothetical protein ABI914_04845, partial [Acidobacteriota bacterium]